MSAGLVEYPVATPKESVRIDADALEECRAAAPLVGKKLAEFISDVLREHVPRIRQEAYEAKYGKPTPPPKRKP